MRFFILTAAATLIFSNLVYPQGKNKPGLLVLAHGGSETWNTLVEESANSLSEKYHVAIAFGMADPKTLESGIKELEAYKVKQIVVVPLFISSHSFILRQTEYFLSKRNELADPLIIMDHSGQPSDHSMPNMPEGQKPVNIIPQQIQTDADLYIAGALDDHDIVAEILFARSRALSVNPTNETLIIVGHGPNLEDDNRNWISNMESLTDKLRKMNSESGIEYKNIFAATVRDDAPGEIYEMAAENLRSLVRQSSKNSTVIIVPLLLSKGGIEKGIVKRLEGLDYKWTGETLLPDPLISEFLERSAEEGLVKMNSKAGK